jgi:hypothetical protein
VLGAAGNLFFKRVKEEIKKWKKAMRLPALKILLSIVASHTCTFYLLCSKTFISFGLTI